MAKQANKRIMAKTPKISVGTNQVILSAVHKQSTFTSFEKFAIFFNKLFGYLQNASYICNLYIRLFSVKCLCIL